MELEPQLKKILLFTSEEEVEQIIKKWRVPERSANNLRRYWKEANEGKIDVH